MRVIIIGAGEVGYHIAKKLSDEKRMLYSLTRIRQRYGGSVKISTSRHCSDREPVPECFVRPEFRMQNS